MQSIANIFKDRVVLEKQANPKIRSERDELILRFYNKGVIQLRDRKTKALQKATIGQVALLLKDCPTRDLHPFYKECDGAREFGRFFWWSLKKKTAKPTQAQAPRSS